LQDLKGVWSELSKVWEQIDQMKEQPWVSVQPRKVLNFCIHKQCNYCKYMQIKN